MEITLSQVSKRYRYEWIFREVDHRFESGRSYAITGPNGSGKSTLLKILSGHLSPSKGEVRFFHHGKKVMPDEVFGHVSYAAPYIELVEEFTLREALSFHQKFKPFAQGMGTAGVLDLLGFPGSAAGKEIRHFSSGMKQRVKLALALCSATPVLLLDEPTTNLDKQGTDWYLRLAERFAPGRLTVVASNVEEDYSFCGERLDILQYKSLPVPKNEG